MAKAQYFYEVQFSCRPSPKSKSKRRRWLRSAYHYYYSTKLCSRRTDLSLTELNNMRKFLRQAAGDLNALLGFTTYRIVLKRGKKIVKVVYS